MKPANVLIAHNGENVKVHLADFGNAAQLASKTDKQDLPLGSFGYAPPELYMRKPYGLKFDVWSLGAVLYFLLTGQKPFWDDSQRKMLRRICTYNINVDS